MNYNQSLATPQSETLAAFRFEADELFINKLETLPFEGTEKWCEFRTETGVKVRVYNPDYVIEGVPVYCTVQSHVSPRGYAETRVHFAPTTDPRRLPNFQSIAVPELGSRLSEMGIEF